MKTEEMGVSVVAERLGVTRQAVNRLIAMGQLPARRVPGVYGPDYYLITREAVEAEAARREAAPQGGDRRGLPGRPPVRPSDKRAAATATGDETGDKP